MENLKTFDEWCEIDLMIKNGSNAQCGNCIKILKAQCAGCTPAVSVAQAESKAESEVMTIRVEKNRCNHDAPIFLCTPPKALFNLKKGKEND